MRTISLLVIGFLASLSIGAQGTINTMFYNVLEFPSANPANRELVLKNILSEYNPDIFMACEIESLEGANIIRDVTFNSESYTFERAPFASNQSGDSPLQQMLYYRRNMFTLENFSIINTNTRDINRYVLKVNTANGSADPVRIYIYISHLKSSEGSANELERLDMVTKFTADLETIPQNAFVLFAGDLNLYSSTEPAYQELLDPTNAITMRDPINTPGDWHNNTIFAGIHTQSTRVSSGGFGAGAGGGMDDRFDFILISENMVSNPKLRYVENSYKSFGNNGNCYDMDVNDPNCAGVFQQELRNNIYSMSDHLPVVLQLQTNQEIVLAGTDFNIAEIGLKLKSTVVTDEIVLLSTQVVQSDFSFAIYNTLGQKVLEWNENPSEEISVSISTLTKGLYYIKTNLPTTEPLKFLKTS
ncbi:hypothetical protein [Rasiella sp. SM2506]|uniref:hypothetical protein n=1 Tax=Rasiella sp. SM2506 TaxID=3423914 RepID=UPI003D798B3E